MGTQDDDFLTWAFTQLRRAGGRRTKGRVAVLTYLAGGGPGRHLSVDQIHLATAGELDRVTIYRTLQTLTRDGVLHCVPGRRSLMFGPSRHSHGHLACGHCGTVIDSAPEAWGEPSSAHLGTFDMDPSGLVAYGRCDGCRR